MSDMRLLMGRGTGGSDEPGVQGSHAGVFTEAVHMDDPAVVQIPPALSAEEVAGIVAQHADQTEADPTYNAGPHPHAAAAHTPAL
jgi:hypothetical protein